VLKVGGRPCYGVEVVGEMGRSVLPFGGRTPDYESPLGVAAWLTEPLGVVTAMLRPMPIDDPLADFLVGELHGHVRALAGPNDLTYALHDWSLATSYDARSRLRLTRWVVAHRHEHAAIAVVAPPITSPLRMGAEVALGVLKLASIPFTLVDDSQAWMAEHGLTFRDTRRPSRPPPPRLLRTG
jgi:hypothetical protein